MTRMLLRWALALVLCATAVQPGWAADEGGELDAVGHAADGVYLDFAPIGKVELPRIFLTHSETGGWGVDAYSSTSQALRSGEYNAVIESGDVVSVNTQAALDELIEASEHVYADLVPAEAGTTIAMDFSITKHLVFGLLAMVICLLIFLPLAGRYKRGTGRETAPKGTFQNLMEVLVMFVRDEIARPNLGDKTGKFLPYLLSAFFFILVANLLGLVPFGAAATSNIAITGVLAAFTFVLTQVNGSKDHWKHVFWPPGVPVPIKFILIPVEILGLFTKPIALAIRLFANMTAGYLVILSLIGLIFTFNAIFGAVAGAAVSPVSLALTVFILLLKLLVAFIQAYVFTMLSALFIGMATEEHDHDHDHAHDHHDALPEGKAAGAFGLTGDGVGEASSQPVPATVGS